MMKPTKTTSKVVIPVNPVPASRPRVTRWGTYYSKTYAAWRKAADELILPSPHAPLDGHLWVIVRIAVQRPKTTKRTNPRGDVDNYVKAALDAITGLKSNPKGYWHDDDQIVDLEAYKFFADEGRDPPGTYLVIKQL